MAYRGAGARELDAAGIVDPPLRAAYQRCRQLHAWHGRTYYLASRLLAPAQRPAVNALYGFARWADDLVDDVHDGRGAAVRRDELDALGAMLRGGLRDGHSDHPVLRAVVDTALRYDIDEALFDAFLASMRMDLEITDYRSYDELATYMHGSAAAIGLQVLPILGTVTSPAEAQPSAAALGVAFQSTNFLRDIGEDLDRGRVYLPADELAAFGVDRELLASCRAARRMDAKVRRALAHFVARTRAGYRRAEPGISMLAPRSRRCVVTAFRLYQAILDEIEAADYAVLWRRVSVGQHRRLAQALRGALVG